jgi:uncharacterized membrane protein YdjX (TVP38/TMEM64 family)
MGLETHATRSSESALTVRGGGGELAGMSSPAKVPIGLLVKLGIVAVALGAVAVLALRGVDVRGLVAQGFDLIRGAGPWVFFGAMAVLPAIGFPITLFYLAAGPAFGEQMTLPGTVAAGLASLVVNFALSYWLAHRALRPAVEWLLSHTQFRVPQVKPEDQLTMTVLVRVTPGPPLVLQSYILGLAGVRFSSYMAVSMAVQTVYCTGVIVFGKALMEGKGGLAVTGAMVLVAAVVLVQVLRKRFAKRDAGQA